jgi:hypothetical protein
MMDLSGGFNGRAKRRRGIVAWRPVHVSSSTDCKGAVFDISGTSKLEGGKIIDVFFLIPHTVPALYAKDGVG